MSPQRRNQGSRVRWWNKIWLTNLLTIRREDFEVHTNKTKVTVDGEDAAPMDRLKLVPATVFPSWVIGKAWENVEAENTPWSNQCIGPESEALDSDIRQVEVGRLW